MPNNLDQKAVECNLLYLHGQVAILTKMVGALIDALGLKIGPDHDFDEFAAELMKKIPKGYTPELAAFADGQRESLRELARLMSERAKRRMRSSPTSQE